MQYRRDRSYELRAMRQELIWRRLRRSITKVAAFSRIHMKLIALGSKLIPHSYLSASMGSSLLALFAG